MDILAKAYDGEVNLKQELKTKNLKVDKNSFELEQKVALEDEILIQLMDNACETEEDLAWCDKY